MIVARNQTRRVLRGATRLSSSTLQYILDEKQYDALKTGDPPERDLNANLKGWDLALKRSYDIVDVFSHKEFNKSLHVYCSPEFVNLFGESRIYTISGCTNNSEDFETCKGMKQYRDGVQLLDFSKGLPYKYHEFQIVTSLPHPIRHFSDPNQPYLSVQEFCRVLNDGGYGIYGCPAHIWRRDLLLDQFFQECDAGSITFKTLINTEIDDWKTFYYTVVVKGK